MQIFLTFVTRGFRHEPCRCLEDSGCEDLPAGPQMQEMAIIATGGYASEPATCCLSKTSIIISGMTSFWIWYAQCDLSDILALHEFCHLDHLFHIFWCPYVSFTIPNFSLDSSGQQKAACSARAATDLLLLKRPFGGLQRPLGQKTGPWAYTVDISWW